MGIINVILKGHAQQVYEDLERQLTLSSSEPWEIVPSSQGACLFHHHKTKLLWVYLERVGARVLVGQSNPIPEFYFLDDGRIFTHRFTTPSTRASKKLFQYILDTGDLALAEIPSPIHQI